MEEKKTPKVIFESGCFDQFDGTQEELNDLVSSITKMFENMTQEEILANSVEVDMDQLMEEDPEFAQHLMDQCAQHDSTEKRKLH